MPDAGSVRERRRIRVQAPALGAGVVSIVAVRMAQHVIKPEP